MASSTAYHRTFLAILVVIITVAFVVVMHSFLITVMMAAIFTAIVYPGYRRVLSWCRGRQKLAAAIYVTLIALLVTIPSIAFVSVLISQGIALSSGAGDLIQEQVKSGELNEQIERLPEGVQKILPRRSEIMAKVTEITSNVAGFVVGKITDITKSTVNLILHIVLMFYSMYFFLIDGHVLLRDSMEYLPLSKTQRTHLVNRFASVSIASIKSTVVIGVIQGTLGGTGFFVAGIPGAVFWGAVMTVLAMIPGIGTALVWIPAAIFLIIEDRIQATIVFALYFILVVGLIDNVLRPRLVGRESQMHELLVLLSTLGGLMVFGLAGFIIGPVIAALFIALWEMQRATVRESDEEPGDA
jgi:predicted PurR-regulated permease PerM